MHFVKCLVFFAQVVDTGFPIRIPVGEETLGRIINVIGDPIDERGPINTDKKLAIHAEAPEFQEMSVEQEILVTGIKVNETDFSQVYEFKKCSGWKNEKKGFIEHFISRECL